MPVTSGQAHAGPCPRAAFSAAIPGDDGGRNAVDKLLGAVESHLKSRSIPAQGPRWPFYVPQLSARVGHGYYIVRVERNLHEADGWAVVVTPAHAIASLFRAGRGAANIGEFQLLCREIHGLLKTFPSVRLLRWYFEGANSSVYAPDQLRWPAAPTR